MTDKELLELAAKAAGISGKYYEFACESGIIDDHLDCGFWNPLTDDGDALRLAVKLGLTIANEHLSSGVTYCTDHDETDYPIVRSMPEPLDQIHETDYAATRRAIVRAAAQIGYDLK